MLLLPSNTQTTALNLKDLRGECPKATLLLSETIDSIQACLSCSESASGTCIISKYWWGGHNGQERLTERKIQQCFELIASICMLTCLQKSCSHANV